MSRKINIMISYKNESTFEEWLKIFDCKKTDLRHSKFDIMPLLRGSVKIILKK